MPNRLKSVRLARLAVVMAVLAFPLLASGVAQAAIAGALPATSSTQPNLLKATTVTGVPNQVQACYDKTITQILLSGKGFFLVGYRTGNTLQASTAAVDPTNTNCVLITFLPGTVGVPTGDGTGNPNPSTDQTATIDFLKYTVLSELAGSVVANTGNPSSAINKADSTTLTPPTTAQSSKDGTRGVSATPNLVGVLTPTGTNQTTNSLTFVFDRNTIVQTSSNFFYVTSAGDTCQGLAVLAGNGTTTITMAFTGNFVVTGTGGTSPFGGSACNPTDSTANAIKAGALDGAVSSAQDPQAFNYNQSAQLSNCANPCTAGGRPSVVSAVLNPANLDQIIYTYDENVTVDPFSEFLPTNAFEAELSNGTFETSNTGVAEGSSVTVTFNGNLSPQAEYAVSAWAGYGAVVPSDNPTLSGLSLPSSVPIGDNTGGLSPGFTTGPDVFGATISGGTVTVTTDQRLGAVNDDGQQDIALMTSTGQYLPAIPQVGFNSSANPGPGTLTLTYPTSQVSNATMIQFLSSGNNTCVLASQRVGRQVIDGCHSCALETPLFDSQSDGPFGEDWCNVPQIVTMVRSASILKAFHAFKAHHPGHKAVKAHKSHKAHKKHKASKKH